MGLESPLSSDAASTPSVSNILSPMPDARETVGAPDRRTLAAFALLVAIAGGNAVAIRHISCEACELDPFWAAATRFLVPAI